MQIVINYEPIPKRRRASTNSIAQALQALNANPQDPTGAPGLFTREKKYAGTARQMANELGINARVEITGNLCRVRLKKAGEAEPVEDPNQIKFDAMLEPAPAADGALDLSE